MYGPRPEILWTASSCVDEGRHSQLAVQQGLDGAPILAQRLSLALRMEPSLLEVQHRNGASTETCTQLTGEPAFCAVAFAYYHTSNSTCRNVCAIIVQIMLFPIADRLKKSAGHTSVSYDDNR